MISGVFAGLLYLVVQFSLWGGSQSTLYGTIFPESKEHMITATADVLTGFYKDRTSSEGDRLLAPYRGKWMKVATTVADIQEDYFQPTVSGAGNFVFGFNKAWLDRLRTLRRGDIIYVIGRLAKVTDSIIVLGDCELLDLPTSAQSTPLPPSTPPAGR
jgi:hypothetical protein